MKILKMKNCFFLEKNEVCVKFGIYADINLKTHKMALSAFLMVIDEVSLPLDLQKRIFFLS